MSLSAEYKPELKELPLDEGQVKFYSLNNFPAEIQTRVNKLPLVIKVLLENLLRHATNPAVSVGDIEKLIDWENSQFEAWEIAFNPVRVLMQDFTGVPAIVDLAVMREAVAEQDGDAQLINPLNAVDLVIDHSVTIDKFGSPSAFSENVKLEMLQNLERYQFLRWGQKAFKNFRVVPPGTGICHQVNLEYLSQPVWSTEVEGQEIAYPDTLVGTDSHTPMINALGVLGWGVGGIEAEAAMLGQPISMNIPEVIGVKLRGSLRAGVTATDLVLTITESLRKQGVVGKFIEYFGDGLNQLPLANRATISNMTPETGATCSFFPVDEQTLNYLRLSGRSERAIKLIEVYSKAQGLWRVDDDSIHYTETLELDLDKIEPCLAGPKRPQDKTTLSNLPKTFKQQTACEELRSVKVKEKDYELTEGDVVIAAITSCTNTSNPQVMMTSGLVAKKAVELGLKCKPWVKTSMAPGSKVVSDYLQQAGLQEYLDRLGFNLVGYGCTTCIGNSGPLPEPIEAAIQDNELTVCSVLSGNRNFEGRIHPLVRANWLASPPLVVAYALAGTVDIDLTTDPIGENQQGESVYLKDIWPSEEEIDTAVSLIKTEMFSRSYRDIFTGNDEWQQLPDVNSELYQWQEDSTYIRKPPYFDSEFLVKPADVKGARVLAILGDSVTTDHISPAGSIGLTSPAGKYLSQKGVAKSNFNSYGSRRGNHEVMIRGTFSNIRLINELLEGVEGGFTRMAENDEVISIFDAATQYLKKQVPLIVIAGKEYGTGSSRDWAAKGTRLLGVRAVIAESFERIHRSNLAGMGVLPLQFLNGDNRKSLNLSGDESFDLTGINDLSVGSQVTLNIHYSDGNSKSVGLLVRLDTLADVAYYQRGGILPFVVDRLLNGKG